MKRSYIILGSIALLVIILFGTYRSSYNTAVDYQETVDQAWGNVQATYQRRADLIPQLIATVKGAAANEKEILTNVTNARAGITNFDPNQIEQEIGNAKNPSQIEAAGKRINTAINLAFEAYPQIRSTENFSELQAQLEGTENRINKSRQDYNESIKAYNTHIRGFLNSMFLNTATFPKKEAFAAAAGSEIAPTVDFSK
jgi:LemA protein